MAAVSQRYMLTCLQSQPSTRTALKGNGSSVRAVLPLNARCMKMTDICICFYTAGRSQAENPTGAKAILVFLDVKS